MEIFKLLSKSEIVAQVLSFLILLTLLRLYVWKRVLEFLDKRKERIALEFQNIEESKSQMEKLKSDYLVKLEKIEDTARLRIQEAITEGKIITEEVRKKAYQQAQEIIDNAKQDIKYELSKAKEELKDKIVDLTIVATENIIKERLTEKDDKRIVKDFLDKVDKI